MPPIRSKPLVIDCPAVGVLITATVMAGQGEPAVEVLLDTSKEKPGEYLLLVEGSVQTGEDGRYCEIGEVGGKHLTMKDALAHLAHDKPDLVVTDIRMPGTTGLDVLTFAKEVDPELPVILMTAQASLQSAVKAVNEGAYYYLQKPSSNDELLAICRRAAEARQLKVENLALKREIRRRGGTSSRGAWGSRPEYRLTLPRRRSFSKPAASW